MSAPAILVFAGSARKASFNKKLAAATAAIARDSGATVTLADLADYPAPVYNGDVEAQDGLPQTMRDFKAMLHQHDGFIIATPEYNGHIPPLLSNTFSWASRTEGDEQGMIAFAGKNAAIMAASPGRLGGIRVIPRLRDTLAELGVVVVPGFVTLPSASNAFDDNGNPVDQQLANNIQKLVKTLVSACQ